MIDKIMDFLAESVCFVWFLVYIPSFAAKEVGMTHHGVMFGVPAWVRDTGEGWDATPKANILLPWILLADITYGLFAEFILPADMNLPTPIRMTKPIE